MILLISLVKNNWEEANMLKLFRKQRGAVSIFLIIVLVPILMITSIFVDMSRIKLAGAMATSAGDLALNTALTDYDAVLKDMYGLFATSQDIDELLVNLEDYYRKSIEAAGIPEAEADNYVDQVMAMLKSSTGTDDLMNIEVTDFSVTTPTGASLANPAIMKSQIVEFMKYRGPINLGMGFVDALKSMKNLDEQTKCIEDKADFYENQQTLLNDLEAAWKDIQTYQYGMAGINFPTGDYIKVEAQAMEGHATALEDTIIPYTIDYLYYYPTYIKNFSYYQITNNGNNWSCADVTCGPIYSEDDGVTANLVLEHLNATLAAEANVRSKKSGEIYELLEVPNDAPQLQKIYIVMKLQKNTDNEYFMAVKQFMQSLVYLKSALEACPEEELATAKVTYIPEANRAELVASGASLEGFCQGQINAHLTLSGTSHLQVYNGHIARLNTYYNEVEPIISGKATTVNNSFGQLVNCANAFHDNITTSIKHLDNAIGHLNTVYNSLTNDSSAYNTALKTWESSASGLATEGDSMGKSDQEEIADVKNMVTADNVNKLINRLKSAKTSLETVKTEIEKYKFEGKLWSDFSTSSTKFDTVKAQLTASQKSTIENMVVTNNDAYNGVKQTVKDTVERGNITTTWTVDNNPDLTKNATVLYTWLYNNYYDETLNYADPASSASKTNSKDGELDSTKNTLKDSADANKSNADSTDNSSTKVDTNISDYIDYLPSSEWAGTLADIKSGTVKTDQDQLLESGSSEVSGFLGEVMSAVEGMATGLRDNLYLTDYIMNMFSYNTYEAEKTVEQEGDMSAFSSWYTKSGDAYEVKPEYEKFAAQALNLTNNSINPNMNYLYGSEIEYIIYGGNDMDANVAKAYGTIFMLRFAFNCVYAFTDAEINNTATSAATAVFGTPPLTPLIPIARVAIILGFAIAESTYDLYVLKTGRAVPLMKNKDTWTMSASNALKGIAGEVLEDVTDVVVDKGYKVLNDALEKTDEELTAMINSGTEDLTNLARAASDSTFQQLNNYANEVVQEVVILCNDINVQSMYEDDYDRVVGMVTTDEKVQSVITQLDTWLEGQKSSSDDLIYEVKSVAVEYMKANGGENITKVFEAIKSTSDSADASTLELMLGDIQDNLNDKIELLAEGANEKLTAYKNQLTDKIKEAAKNGAESLRAELKSQISSTFGTSKVSNKATTSIVSSLLAWTYSDYLMLFLLISTIADEEGVLLRLADVIELNMQHMNGEYASITTTETVTKSRFFGLWTTTEEKEVTAENQKAFKLSNSYTYLTIDATLEVKPLFMTLPFMADTTESELTGSDWYTIHYTGTMGY